MFHRPSSSNPQTASPQGEDNAMNQSSQNSEESNDRSVDIPAASPFQRPGQPAAQAPRPAAPSYGAYPAAYGTPSPVVSSEVAKGRRLVIGQGITMSGEIESCDTLVVEGTVEAALKGASVLEVAETGMFYGTVEIDEATIAGKFEGDLTVNGRLTVRATGSITGAIAYKELAVEAGATIDGKITPTTGGRGASSEKKSHKGGSDFPMKGKNPVANPQGQDDLPILQRAAS